MTKQLWLVSETEKARLFALSPMGQQLWVPRSVVKSILKFATEPGDLYRRCEVEIEDWWARKNRLN
jgi:hypothetical protein